MSIGLLLNEIDSNRAEIKRASAFQVDYHRLRFLLHHIQLQYLQQFLLF
jgi:hypothetical protein